MAASDHAILVTAIGSSTTIVVAATGAIAAVAGSRRERRRLLYGEAVKEALCWTEQLYRVRRRQAGHEAELDRAFYELQRSLAYHHAWIGGESLAMQRSYALLVERVKCETAALIAAAWEQPVRPIGNARPGDAHPDTTVAVARFLADVRGHLSPWPWRKAAVAWRNRLTRHQADLRCVEPRPYPDPPVEVEPDG